ncbi:uncharacterized protein LOC118118337 [Hippoglossus stenolepis]|uniref:uncharacterized protein LOC118118337 n=1 Tax=Hippoglossus stenolepis TaxID=195615 RepID=UPI001FAF2160|nr:uncharacterized protein LOC118118337 [Hippoglossus stenolepis]
MMWLEAEVKLTCPILQSPDATPAQHPWKHPVPHRPSSFYHPKRHVTRQKGKWREATMGVREGTIVFGRGAESHVANGNRKAPSNASAVEDERAYQADSAGLSNGQAQDTSPREASWKRMAPSLQCGGDQMKFRAVGPGASQFAVDQGNAHPMPLSLVPSTCGYTMQMNSLALVMLVPYDGCNMVQERVKLHAATAAGIPASHSGLSSLPLSTHDYHSSTNGYFDHHCSQQPKILKLWFSLPGYHLILVSSCLCQPRRDHYNYSKMTIKLQ